MMNANLPSISFRPAPFDDGRGLYPDRITAKTPIGMREAVREAAEKAGVSCGKFVRDAIEARLRQAGVTTATEV